MCKTIFIKSYLDFKDRNNADWKLKDELMYSSRRNEAERDVSTRAKVTE